MGQQNLPISLKRSIRVEGLANRVKASIQDLTAIAMTQRTCLSLYIFNCFRSVSNPSLSLGEKVLIVPAGYDISMNEVIMQ